MHAAIDLETLSKGRHVSGRPVAAAHKLAAYVSSSSELLHVVETFFQRLAVFLFFLFHDFSKNLKIHQDSVRNPKKIDKLGYFDLLREV